MKVNSIKRDIRKQIKNNIEPKNKNGICTGLSFPENLEYQNVLTQMIEDGELFGSTESIPCAHAINSTYKNPSKINWTLVVGVIVAIATIAGVVAAFLAL